MALPKERLLDAMARGVEPATQLLKTLANADRLAILCCLIEGEKSVGELELALALRQPSLSQQLARLRTDEMVSTRRDGKAIYYSISSHQAQRIIEVLHDMYCKE